MNTPRLYSTKRLSIVDAIVEKLRDIDGTGDFLTDLDRRVEPRLKFWDEIDQFPAVHLNAGTETREYQAGGYKDRFLSVTVRCYVKEEDAVVALERLLEDVETVLEENSRLAYTDRRGATHYTQLISVISMETDEGVLEPYGVGEMLIEVRY